MIKVYHIKMSDNLKIPHDCEWNLIISFSLSFASYSFSPNSQMCSALGLLQIIFPHLEVYSDWLKNVIQHNDIDTKYMMIIIIPNFTSSVWISLEISNLCIQLSIWYLYLSPLFILFWALKINVTKIGISIFPSKLSLI